MKAAVHELLPSEMEAWLEPVFKYAVTEIRDNKMDLIWSHFLPEWQSWTERGVARTWGCAGAIAGGVFTQDLFSGVPSALLMFWLSTPDARRAGAPLRVLDSFEQAAKEWGAKPSVAWHSGVSPDRLLKVYRKRGYQMSEVIFKKAD